MFSVDICNRCHAVLYSDFFSFTKGSNMLILILWRVHMIDLSASMFHIVKFRANLLRELTIYILYTYLYTHINWCFNSWQKQYFVVWMFINKYVWSLCVLQFIQAQFLEHIPWVINTYIIEQDLLCHTLPVMVRIIDVLVFGEFTGHYLVSVIGWKIGPCSRSNGYCCIISWPDYLNTHTHIYSIYATKMNDLVCVALVSLMHNDCLHDFHRHEYLQIFKARERLLGRWFTVILYQCFSKNFAKLIL